MKDTSKPYSIIATSPTEGYDYWVPYCPTFSTIERAADHARAVWGQDWQGGRYSLRVGIITPEGAVQDLDPYVHAGFEAGAL